MYFISDIMITNQATLTKIYFLLIKIYFNCYYKPK